MDVVLRGVPTPSLAAHHFGVRVMADPQLQRFARRMRVSMESERSSFDHSPRVSLDEHAKYIQRRLSQSFPGPRPRSGRRGLELDRDEAFVPTSLSALDLAAEQGPFILPEMSTMTTACVGGEKPVAPSPGAPVTHIPGSFTPSSLPLKRQPSIIAEASSDEEDEPDYFENDERPVILFDGVCNLCNRGVNFVLSRDKKPEGTFRFAALQSEAGRALLKRAGRDPYDISSIVLVEKDAHFIKSDAVMRIAARLNVPWMLMGFLARPVPGSVRDFFYDKVATNRYGFFGKSSSCRLSDPRFAARFIK